MHTRETFSVDQECGSCANIGYSMLCSLLSRNDERINGRTGGGARKGVGRGGRFAMDCSQNCETIKRTWRCLTEPRGSSGEALRCISCLSGKFRVASGWPHFTTQRHNDTNATNALCARSQCVTKRKGNTSYFCPKNVHLDSAFSEHLNIYAPLHTLATLPNTHTQTEIVC